MNNKGKGILMSWPRYVEGTTSISRLMHKQTYLTLATRDYQRWINYFILNYYRNDYIINYYTDHRLADTAMYTAFKLITNRLMLHKVHKKNKK